MDEMRRDISHALMICNYSVIKTVFMYFVYVILAVRVVADVTERLNVIRIGIQNLNGKKVLRFKS